MRLGQNIHPSFPVGDKERKWKTVTALFRGEGKGNCINLELTDQDAGQISIAFHYDDIKHAQEFVDKLKTAILSLPAIVRQEEKNPVGFVKEEK